MEQVGALRVVQVVINGLLSTLNIGHSMRNSIVVLAALIAIPIASVHSQISVQRDWSGPKNVISIQPLNVLLKAIDVTAYSAEYERAITERFTLGIGGTYWDGSRGDDSVKYSSADLKVRYYVFTNALRGLSVGASVGYAKAETVTNTLGQETFGGPSFGALAEYQLLVNSFAIAIGGGVKNVQVSDKEISDKHHISAPYPTARFSIGFAF